jgi:hypothetical protein
MKHGWKGIFLIMEQISSLYISWLMELEDLFFWFNYKTQVI